MYPYELEQFIKERNYRLGGDDLGRSTSVQENPQLMHVQYKAYDNHYNLWDNEGNYFNFEAMPYEETNEKGLVKRLERKLKWQTTRE